MLSIPGPEPLENLDPAAISPRDHALFLDFDGTIAEIVVHPDAAWPSARWSRLVPRLRERFGGALAIVTGRELGDVEKRFPECRPMAIGAMYGSLRRSHAGQLTEAAADLADTFAEIAAHVQAFTAPHRGLLVEEKSAGVSLHYRSRPELEGFCFALMKEAIAPYREFIEVVPGKRVFEARPLAVDKGRCIAAFLLEPPFEGRVPVFAGDDVPDEEGFRFVNARSGISIKVGEGETAARFRTTSPATLAAWFEMVAKARRLQLGETMVR